MKIPYRLIYLTLGLSSLGLIAPLHAQQADDDEFDEDVIELSPFIVTTVSDIGYLSANCTAGTSLNMGATPGGAQDISFVRLQARNGNLPLAAALTAEGLFSEHDLPLELGRHQDQLLFIQSAAIPAALLALPEVSHLGQVGFSSGLDAHTWQRAPLNLVAVVDKSGSMSGQPLALVRASLRSILEHMQTGDQLSIVLYGSQTHVFLHPTLVNDQTRDPLARAIDRITSHGSTSMEAGLKLGFDLARNSQSSFVGTTRVMLFTDEQPNVGRVDAESFMQMAEGASTHGIGLTTIGVGIQFGTELATRISGVRGGNLFFFPDGDTMRKTFAEDFDTMITELAYDFKMRLEPTPGFKIAGIFGIPNEAVQWDGEALLLEVKTIFLSRRKGAIFFALAPTEGQETGPHRMSAPLAQVHLSYIDANSGRDVRDQMVCIEYPFSHDGLTGLRRGHHLVDQFTTIKKATLEYDENQNPRLALTLLDSLQRRLDGSDDPALDAESALISDLRAAISEQSGIIILPGEVHPITGLPLTHHRR